MYTQLLLVLLNPGQGDGGLVPGPKVLGPDGSGLCGASRGGAEVVSPLSTIMEAPKWCLLEVTRRQPHVQSGGSLLICQKSADMVGFLGYKSLTYKTLQRRSRYRYKMIVTWCGVRLG